MKSKHKSKPDLHDHLIPCTDGTWWILESDIPTSYSVLAFVQRVTETDEGIWEKLKYRTGRMMKVPSRIGGYRKLIPSFAGAYTRNYIYSPMQGFFYGCLAKHDIRFYIQTEPTEEVFESFVEFMRQEAKRVRLGDQHRDWLSKQNKNWESMKTLVRKVFATCTCPVVIRNEFMLYEGILSGEEIESLRSEFETQRNEDLEALLAMGGEEGWVIGSKAALEAMEADSDDVEPGDLPPHREFKCRVSIEQIKADLKRYFKKLNRTEALSKHLLGYAWRIDCAPGAGHHVHFVAFMDGHFIKNDAFYAEQFGELWVQVTKRRGYFINDNRDPGKYIKNGVDRYGIGRVEHTDEKKLINLWRTLYYLCTAKKALDFYPINGRRMFQTNFLRDPNDNRGRNRTRDSATSMRFFFSGKNVPPSIRKS